MLDPLSKVITHTAGLSTSTEQWQLVTSLMSSTLSTSLLPATPFICQKVHIHFKADLHHYLNWPSSLRPRVHKENAEQPAQLRSKVMGGTCFKATTAWRSNLWNASCRWVEHGGTIRYSYSGPTCRASLWSSSARIGTKAGWSAPLHQSRGKKKKSEPPGSPYFLPLRVFSNLVKWIDEESSLCLGLAWSRMSTMTQKRDSISCHGQYNGGSCSEYNPWMLLPW